MKERLLPKLYHYATRHSALLLEAILTKFCLRAIILAIILMPLLVLTVPICMSGDGVLSALFGRHVYLSVVVS